MSRSLLVMAMLLAMAGSAFGEPVLTDLDGIVDLAVPWRFEPSDDPNFARPDFDDSGWREVQIPTGFGRKDASSSIAWYRLRAQIEPAGRGTTLTERRNWRLALGLGKVDSAYEVFVGGRRLGGVGDMPPRPAMDYDRHGIYPIPVEAISEAGDVVIALRVWKSPQTWGQVGGPHEGPFLLGDETRLVRREYLSELPQLFLVILFLIIGFFHLELFRRRPRQKEYLWFWGCTAAFATYTFLRTQWKYALTDNFLLLKETEYVALFFLVTCFIQLVWPLLGLPIGKTLRVYQGLNIATGLLVGLTPGVALNMMVLPYWELSVLLLIIYGAWAIFHKAWHNHPEARTIAFGTIGSAATFLNDIGIDRGFFVGHRLVAFGFGFLLISLAVSLANRFTRTHRELEMLRQDLEQRVDERTHQLLEANQAKSRFLATMSHEIRTPLNGVIGLTELMLNTRLDAKQREYAEKTLRSGDALLALIEDILDFSKIEAGKMEIEARPFFLADVLGQTIELLAPRAAEKNLDLSYFTAPEVPPAITGDPDRLRQILVNLVGNAIKFTEEGHVRIRVQPAEEGLHFEVEDTGIGIAEDRQEALFDAFTQVDASNARRHGGTGLGLAISRRLCEMLGGRLRVESALGKGSMFHFTIPVQLADEDSVERPRTAETPLPWAQNLSLPPLSLLLAEDDDVNRTVALGMLASLGYDADIVTNGLEALEAVEKKQYDVIFLDIQMPELDGLETARRIKSQPLKPSPRLIAMTAHAVKGDRESCLAAGMDDYLSKPLKPEKLAAVLRHCGSGRATPHVATVHALERIATSTPSSVTSTLTESGEEALVLDHSVLDKLQRLDAGQGAVLTRAIDAFLNKTPRRLSALEQAFSDGNSAAVERLAHSLRSSAGSLGGMTMMALCAELEHAAQCEALSEASPLLQLIEEQFAHLEPLLVSAKPVPI